MKEVPHPPDGGGNPLVTLAVAVIYAILYVLDSIRALVTWLTITLPRCVLDSAIVDDT
jgi:lysophospholipid hydrolase